MIEIMGFVWCSVEANDIFQETKGKSRYINLFLIYPNICMNSKNKWKNWGYALAV